MRCVRFCMIGIHPAWEILCSLKLILSDGDHFKRRALEKSGHVEIIFLRIKRCFQQNCALSHTLRCERSLTHPERASEMQVQSPVIPVEESG